MFKRSHSPDMWTVEFGVSTGIMTEYRREAGLTAGNWITSHNLERLLVTDAAAGLTAREQPWTVTHHRSSCRGGRGGGH